ncbi:EAL-associated domain-containing protein [Psychrobacillus psychrodurans]|uniref:EAL domain-containing protein n=1 Tax=Psychrobacillus psychrodurans TaxID=126157 RepID=UPI0008E1D0EE|nr:EAL-associated domain-containing protein [Psychrobacillus psychrodurans]MCZ8542084.1 EAL domain-containing protein [Psychrobacillus psychrodurans]SFN16235.1 EAL domain, c-di-GMP-specific phosphodiesterase class I (or its enzymatically inactive variant) [Psychrobacillus psychrodurans]
MDAIDVLTNKEHIKAYYQPIFSADEHIVVAYEVLGKLINKEKLINLNTLAYDEDIPVEYRVEIEHKILRLALSELMEKTKDYDIYLPCNANLLILDYGESYFNILNEYVSEDSLSRIVLVLSEHDYKGDFSQLSNILRYYRTYGMKIAINQVGSESHIDYIKMLSPNILKVNIEKLTYESWSAQNDLFASLGSLARKMGANMLFEGIDSVHQLQFAWKNGGRYYQGKYLADAQRDIILKDLLKDHFKEKCQQFITTEKRLLEEKYNELKNLQNMLEKAVELINPNSENVAQLLLLAEELDDCSFRIYICDEDGFQISPNIMRVDKKWDVQEDAVNKNWSWRPYFLKTIIKMRNDQSGEFSDMYSDIVTGEMMRTFSIPLNNSEYLFIDISYDYLFRHNIFR